MSAPQAGFLNRKKFGLLQVASHTDEDEDEDAESQAAERARMIHSDRDETDANFASSLFEAAGQVLIPPAFPNRQSWPSFLAENL
jgi:hypothetical protein